MSSGRAKTILYHSAKVARNASHYCELICDAYKMSPMHYSFAIQYTVSIWQVKTKVRERARRRGETRAARRVALTQPSLRHSAENCMYYPEEQEGNCPIGFRRQGQWKCSEFKSDSHSNSVSSIIYVYHMYISPKNILDKLDRRFRVRKYAKMDRHVFQCIVSSNSSTRRAIGCCRN